MKRFILTGTPGAGKTAILRQLGAGGYSVVEESLRFEQIHEETYRSFGYEIVNIAPGNLSGRAQAILVAVQNLSSGVPGAPGLDSETWA